MLGDYKMIKMRDRIGINTYIREVGASRWLIMTHGVGEHLGRHKTYLSELLGRDYNLCIYDLRGHGRSLGKSHYIEDFKTYVDDLVDIVNYLIEKFSMNKYALMGHSMGGLISLGFIQNALGNVALKPERVFVNAPAIFFGGLGGFFSNAMSRELNQKLANINLSLKLPKMVDLDNLSHNPIIKQKYINDPLTASKLHSRLLFQMLLYSKEVTAKNIHFQNLMCTVGGGDKIVNPKNMNNYFLENVDHANFQIIDNAYHEIHNEIELYRLHYFSIIKDFFITNFYNDLKTNQNTTNTKNKENKENKVKEI